MYNRKLTDEQALEIMASKEKLSFLAEKYSVSESMVSRIRTGKRRGGDVAGRPVSRGSQSSYLKGFEDRNDRDYFNKLDLYAIYITENRDGERKIAVTGNPWLVADIKTIDKEIVRLVFWVPAKDLAFRIKRHLMEELAVWKRPNGRFLLSETSIVNSMREYASKNRIQLEEHPSMLFRVAKQRQFAIQKRLESLQMI